MFGRNLAGPFRRGVNTTMRFRNRAARPRSDRRVTLANEETLTEQEESQNAPAEEIEDGNTVEQDIHRLSEEVQKLKGERDELQQQVLRTLADFQNFRRRNQEQAAQLRQFANENFVSALLPVLDNFERTVNHIEAGATLENMLDGVRAVERQLRTVLESQNVRRIEAVGQPFDPLLHEAIGVVDSEGQPPNTVLEEVEPGYRLGDKVIRPARVRVSAS
jgi:molecular chaperone GrpE